MASKCWEDVREEVLDRDGRQCIFCGIAEEDYREEYGQGLDVHHILPKRDGGEDKPENLAPMCRSCHATMENRHATALAEMKEQLSSDDDVKEIAKLWNEWWTVTIELENSIHEFLTDHPRFARDFGLYAADDGQVHDSGAWNRLERPVENEWDCAVAWGYQKGVAEALSEIDARTSPDFNDNLFF